MLFPSLKQCCPKLKTLSMSKPHVACCIMLAIQCMPSSNSILQTHKDLHKKTGNWNTSPLPWDSEKRIVTNKWAQEEEDS